MAEPEDAPVLKIGGKPCEFDPRCPHQTAGSQDGKVSACKADHTGVRFSSGCPKFSFARMVEWQTHYLEGVVRERAGSSPAPGTKDVREW